MALSESIYFIVMFTLPAAMHIIYNSHIRMVPRNQPDKSVELAENVIFCAVVFLINVIFLNRNIVEFADYMLMSEADKALCNFGYLGFIIKYTVINLITSFITIVFWYKLGKRFFMFVVNKINRIEHRADELEFGDVWRNVFESNKLFNVFDTCIVIEQSSTLITAGILQTFQSPNSESRELLLRETEKIREILKEDEKESPKDKIFYPAIYEYYDGKSGLLFKFYDLAKYREKCLSKQKKS